MNAGKRFLTGFNQPWRYQGGKTQGWQSSSCDASFPGPSQPRAHVFPLAVSPTSCCSQVSLQSLQRLGLCSATWTSISKALPFRCPGCSGNWPWKPSRKSATRIHARPCSFGRSPCWCTWEFTHVSTIARGRESEDHPWVKHRLTILNHLEIC